MARTRIHVAALTLAAGVLAPAPALPQESVTVEREAVAAVARAGEAVERARDGDALWRAAEQAVAAAEHAADAFVEADRARDAALIAYRAAYREAVAGAVTCANGYPCTNGRVDPFDGFAAAFAAHFELIADMSAANAAYVDAVGIPGAGAARARAVRLRGLAARMSDPGAIDDPGRWNALVGSVGAEIDAGNALHRHANEARHAADLALVDDVTRVVEAIHLAAYRVAQRSRPATGGAAVDGRTDSAAGARAPAGTVGDAVLRAALDTAQGAMESLRSRIVAAAISVPDVVPTRAAEPGVPGGDDAPRAEAAVSEPADGIAEAADPEPASEVAPRADTEAPEPEPLDDAPARADLEAPDPEPANEVAPRADTEAPGLEPVDGAPARADTADAHPEPVDDVARWAGALTALARAAEQAAADAEAAAGGSGSSRASSCSGAEARVTTAAARVSSLTVGDDRPRFVPARTGRETYSDLFHLLDAARRRARAACRSIGR